MQQYGIWRVAERKQPFIEAGLRPCLVAVDCHPQYCRVRLYVAVVKLKTSESGVHISAGRRFSACQSLAVGVSEHFVIFAVHFHLVGQLEIGAHPEFRSAVVKL